MLNHMFYYTLAEFCERYTLNQEYVISVIAQKYPLVVNAPEGIDVFLSEIDLLNLLSLGNFDSILEDDPRKEVKIKLPL